MSVWAINGQTFETLRLGNLQISYSSQAADEATFVAAGSAYDGDALFAYRQPVTITKDGAPWFSGLVTTVPRSGGDRSESLSYRVSGPWWYLEECTYEQSWKVFSTITNGLITHTTSRVILGKGTGSTHITSGQQIAAAVQWAITRGAPIALGTIDPAVPLPWDEQVDMKCSQVIQRMMQLSPDCICWWDHTVSPPKFHCRRRANLTPVIVTVPGPEAVAIVRRDDLLAPGVLLRFEQTASASIDGREVSYNQVVEDAAGDTGDLACVRSTIELAGSRRAITSMEQTIQTEEIPAGLADKDWWIRHIPALGELDWTRAELGNPRRSGAVNVRGEAEFSALLIEGQVHDWMPVKARDEEFTVDVRSTVYDETGSEQTSITTHAFRGVTTTAQTGTDGVHTYRRTASDSYDPGEPIPEGMAAALYAAWSQVQFEGRVSVSGQEVSGLRGRALNIAGGRAEWATMRALVQSIREDVDSGRTTLTFGPARHVTVDSLLALMRSFRARGYSYHFQDQDTGQPGGGSDDLSLSGKSAKPEATAAKQVIQRLVLAAAGKKITLDPAMIGHAGADIRPREIEICTDSGSKHVWILMSEPY